MPGAIFALAVATFAIGTTEFVIVGLLPSIAADLRVSPPTAGLLVSLYALAIALDISAGSYIGGQLLQGPGLPATPYAPIAIAIVALVITTVALRPQPAPAK